MSFFKLFEIFDYLKNQEKSVYLLYFFPILSSGYLYFVVSRLQYLLLFVFSIISVLLMQSYHLAYKISLSKKEVKSIIKAFIKISPGSKDNVKFIRKRLLFTLLVVLWNIAFFWSWMSLKPYLINQVCLILFIIQISLYGFHLSFILFWKNLKSK